MSEPNLNQLFGTNERRMSLIHHALSAAMIACLMVVVVRFAQALAPDWQGEYLLPLTFFMAVEAMLSQRLMREHDFLSREWILYRAAEWVVILVGVKLLLYALRGFGQLFRDLPGWKTDFINSFFTGEYLFVVGTLIVTAGIASIFGELLARLEGDEKLLRLERESGIVGERPAARRSLANLILVLGAVMIFLSGILRLDWEALWGEAPPRWSGAAFTVVVYFTLGMVLLSLTQFSILRVHWSLDRIPFEPKLGQRWVIYSLIFLVAAALVAALLPTRYSIGLLDIVGYGVAVVSFVLTLLLIVILTPIFFVMSLFARLLSAEFSYDPPPPEVLRPPEIPAMGSGSWLEMLRSILFWVVFFGVIGYSLYYYLSGNRELIQRLRKVPFLAALGSLFIWLGRMGRDLQQGAASGVRAGLERLRRRGRAVKPWGFLSLRNLSPREKVMFYYLAMVRRGGEAGYPRQPGQTPVEYSQELRNQLPEIESELGMITGEFNEARYSRREIQGEEAGQVQQIWQRIRKALRRTGD